MLNNIKTTNLIVEAQVIGKEQNHDSHNSEYETVTLAVKDIIERKLESKTIEIEYYLNQISDDIYITPKFELGKNYILILHRSENNKFSLLGGDLGKYLVEGNKINNVSLSKNEFNSLLKRVQNNNNNTVNDLTILNDIAGEMDGPLKLDGEFAIIHPAFHNKPKGNTIIFYINPSGAKDKNGNQLSFNQVYNVISNAISSWNSTSCSYTVFSLSATQYNGSRINGNGISTITFESIYGLSNGKGDPPSLTSEITEFDIILNGALRWNTESTYPSNFPTYSAPNYFPYLSYPTIGPVDLQDVSTHELGHAVGLAHIYGYNFTMKPTDYTVNNWWTNTSRRALGWGDVAGKIYMDPDFSTSSTQPSSKMLLSNNSDVIFNGSLTVPSGYYLEIESGKYLAFASGASLTINGTLKANGQAFPNNVFL